MQNSELIDPQAMLGCWRRIVYLGLGQLTASPYRSAVYASVSSPFLPTQSVWTWYKHDLLIFRI